MMGVFVVSVDLKSGYRGGSCLEKPCVSPESQGLLIPAFIVSSPERHSGLLNHFLSLHSTQLSSVPTFTSPGPGTFSKPLQRWLWRLGGGLAAIPPKAQVHVGAKEGTHVPKLAH